MSHKIDWRTSDTVAYATKLKAVMAGECYYVARQHYNHRWVAFIGDEANPNFIGHEYEYMHYAMNACSRTAGLGEQYHVWTKG